MAGTSTTDTIAGRQNMASMEARPQLGGARQSEEVMLSEQAKGEELPTFSRANAIAIEQFLSTCRRIAHTLDAEFVEHHSPPADHKPTLTTRYLVPTLPHGIGIAPVGCDVVELICVTRNSHAIFWEFVKERFELPDTEQMPDEAGPYSLPIRFELACSISIARIYHIRSSDPQDLVYHVNPMSSSFDLGNRIHHVQGLRQVLAPRKSIEAPAISPEEHRVCVLALSAWAFANGLVSSSVTAPLASDLTYEHFLRMIPPDLKASLDCAAIDSGDAIEVRKLIKTVCGPYLRAPWLLQGMLEVSSRATLPLKRVYQRVVDFELGDNHGLSFDRELGLDLFIQDFEAILVIKHEPGPPEPGRAIEIAVSFQKHLRNAYFVEAHLWPAIIATGDVILGISDGSEKLHLKIENLFDSRVGYDHQAEWYGIVTLKPSEMLEQLRIAREAQSLGAGSSIGGDGAIKSSDRPSHDGKFRHAKSAIDRLTWDQTHKDIAYTIGYEDRFDGLVYKDLSEWQKHTEEEDFIPLHRVRVIRRKDDQVIIWDRDRRIDNT